MVVQTAFSPSVGVSLGNAALQMFYFNVQSLLPERFKGIYAFGGYM